MSDREDETPDEAAADDAADDAEQAAERPSLRLRRDTAPAGSGPSFDQSTGEAAAEGGGSKPETAAGREAMDKAMNETDEAKPASPLKTGLRIAVAVVVLVAGFKFGFGPLISHARGKMTTVVVKNHSDDTYTLRLGWRMLTGQLMPQGQEHFELAVGMPERQGLRMEKDGVVRKLRVPMRPGGVTLVNLDQAGTYFTYNTQDVAEKNIEGVEAMCAQIAARETPVALKDVLKSAHALGDGAFIEERKDLYFELTKFRPTPTVGYYASPGETPAEPDMSLPVFTNMPLDITVANGTIKHFPQDTLVLEGSVAAPKEITVSFGSMDVVIPKGAQLAIVDASDKTGRLQQVRLRLGNQTVEVKGKTFTGTWDYAATVRDDGEGNAWLWTYNGSTKDELNTIKATMNHLGESALTETTNPKKP